ncbi:MAG: nucleotide-binding protein [Oscillospiraceae bacterium]|nr:nucleotide-binding protein [Oscillospiraceae bacterium]MBR4093693.1 nucleotide-binding protein [Oscillospiraceae bacterium]
MKNIEKMKEIIADADFLLDHGVMPSAPAFQAWHTNVERCLIKIFGEESFEHKDFLKTKFFPSAYVTNADILRCCKAGILSTKLILIDYLKELEENAEGNTDPIPISVNFDFSKIFIVHGHDGELKQSVARIIEKQGIEAVILNEQANQGRTIIEKFEDYSDVSGAICLFTADDLGRAKNNSDDLPRARQNVVFEAGYFMGKLSRSNVVIIAEKGVEIPSDMQGIVYTDKNKWELNVLKELKTMGYDIDLNKLF